MESQCKLPGRMEWMMLNKEELSTRMFVKNNKTLFEEIADEYSNMRNSDDVEYSMLNYDKILNEMCDFITGYIKYKDDGDDKYNGKILKVTINFYESVFTDTKRYRQTIVLYDIREINKLYLKNTKRLTQLMDDMVDRSKEDPELYQLLKLSNNQYKRISKVYKDDMEIYRWLNTANSKVFNHNIPMDLKLAFKDKSTPVIHRI